MYIQSYQIHNVLNEYRKRLSQTPERSADSKENKSRMGDRVQLSEAGHRQAIIDQVSAKIVERITTFGPQHPFEEAVSTYLTEPDETSTASQGRNGFGFTYTMIDENNRKLTQSFTIEGTGSSLTPMEKADTGSSLGDTPRGAGEMVS